MTPVPLSRRTHSWPALALVCLATAATAQSTEQRSRDPGPALAEVYTCTSPQRCWTDGKCEVFDTRLHVIAEPGARTFETRWPEVTSDNALTYRAATRDTRTLVSGMIGSYNADGPYVATLQIFPDLSFMRSSVSLLGGAEGQMVYGFAQEGHCERRADG